MIRYHSLKINNSCLNSCSFCSEIKQDFFSPEKLNDFLNQPKLPESIKIFGGEPLTVDFLTDLVANLRRKGARRIMIKTTAAPLSDFNLTFNLVSKGAHHFEIEFFSFEPAIYQAMTNSDLSLELVLQGISNLRRLSLENGQNPFLSFRIIVNSANINEVTRNLVFLLKFRPDRFVLSIVPPLEKLDFTLEKVREAIKIANLNLIWLQTENVPFCLLGEDCYHYGELLTSSFLFSFKASKLKSCLECSASKVCQGVPSFYQELEDFRVSPLISSEKFEDFEFLKKEMERL